ncbi:MarR family transcriptional regulator [Edaphobacter sp. HDX4]|uniref:MarR family winged helix-turn-helix transcriptional regulator n=1 Tax=Edaphobacter sp. HDX4 TaxID=2794064 RepID=UPI002FE6AF98
MSTARTTGTAKRAEMLQRLGDLARRFSTRTVFLHQVIAQTVGLSATDTRCLDLILTDPENMTTAGRLAHLSGLTTGAITHILDRLEKRGFIKRVRDTEDRRKVFVRVQEESLAPVVPKYRALGEAYKTLVEHYTDSELKLIFDYMEKMSEMNERLMADAVAAQREG